MRNSKFDNNTVEYFKNKIYSQFYKDGYNGLYISWLTGLGKTYSISNLLIDYCKNNTGKRILVSSSVLALLNQVKDMFYEKSTGALIYYEGNEIEFVSTQRLKRNINNRDIDILYHIMSGNGFTNLNFLYFMRNNHNIDKFIVESDSYINNNIEETIIDEFNLVPNKCSEWTNKNMRNDKMKTILK